MSRGLIFWVLMLVWAIFAGAVYSGYGGHYGPGASTLLEFVLFLLLGWQVYGSPVKP